jgi:hypothetical protein
LNLIHYERLKLVPDLLLNFQFTLDRLILFLMKICLLRIVTFIDLSAPCSADSLTYSLKFFYELSKIYLGQILLRRSIPHHLIFSKSLFLISNLFNEPKFQEGLMTPCTPASFSSVMVKKTW